MSLQGGLQGLLSQAAELKRCQARAAPPRALSLTRARRSCARSVASSSRPRSLCRTRWRVRGAERSSGETVPSSRSGPQQPRRRADARAPPRRRTRETRRRWRCAPPTPPLGWTQRKRTRRVPPSREHGAAALRLSRAQAAGNAALGEAGGGARALECYTRALALLLWFDKRSEASHEERVTLVNAALPPFSLTPAHAERSAALAAAALTNGARCLLAQGRAGCAAAAASLALAHAAPHAADASAALLRSKALYWRSRARQAAGTSEGDAAAAEDAAAALRLQPDDPLLRRLAAETARARRAGRARATAAAAAMFARGAEGGAAFQDGAPAEAEAEERPRGREAWAEAEEARRARAGRAKAVTYALLLANLLYRLYRVGRRAAPRLHPAGDALAQADAEL